MARRLFTLLSALSLLLCVAVVVLWVRSQRHRDVLWGPGGQYVLHSEGGRLTAYGPPPGAPVPAGEAPRKLVRQLTNAHVVWDGSEVGIVPGDANGPAARLVALGAAATPALLEALNDPEKFAAAHALLTLIHPLALPHEPGDSWYTLRVSLAPDGEGPTHVDPGQLPAIRDAWHRALDVRVGSVPYWACALACGAASPVLWVLAFRRTAHLRRKGRCRACGYDLRATPARCPECGTIPARRKV